MNILIINENSTGYITDYTNLIYLFILSCGIQVITSNNPIKSILNLILLFSAVACYLILLDASFIGLSYLLVYVGAVSILFLFILMLINVRISEFVVYDSEDIPLSLFIMGIFIISMLIIIYRISMTLFSYKYNLPLNDIETRGLAEENFSGNSGFVNEINNNIYNSSAPTWDLAEENFFGNSGFVNEIKNNIYNSSAPTWDTLITSTSHINSIGNIMYTSYPILLLIISIILLLSMIGAIVITVRR